VTTYTASIDTTGPDSILHRTVLAGLPNSYRLVGGAAEVVVVSGSEPARAERAAASGARAVVLDEPGQLTLEELVAVESVARQNDCIVVPAPRYGPRLAAASALLEGADVDLLESSITSRDSFRSSFVEQLAMLRQVLGSVASVRVLHSSMSHYSLEAAMVDHPQSHVVLNGLVSADGVEEASLHAIGADQRLVVRIDAGPFARPADIMVFDVHGAHSPWPLHQHAHRITLARLHRLLTTDEGSLTYSLQDLRHDLRLADAVMALQ
jgi:hypothetical protein